MPLVTIIVPVHDREGFLPETLDSVRAQTFGDWECIVVDDHSTDRSLEVARRYEAGDPRFRALTLPDPKRFGNAARNYGLSVARGEFVNFVDSDDMLAPSKLDLQLAAFAADPTLDMVACRRVDFVAGGAPAVEQVQLAPPERWLDAIWLGVRTSALWDTNAPLWRTESIARIGGWDEDIRSWQDHELNLRALLSGLRIRRLEEVLVHVRLGEHLRVNTRSAAGAERRREALLCGWRQLERAGATTGLRRHLLHLQLYDAARTISDSGQPGAAMRAWLADSRSTGQPRSRVVWGAIALLGARCRGARWAGNQIRRRVMWRGSIARRLVATTPGVGR